MITRSLHDVRDDVDTLLAKHLLSQQARADELHTDYGFLWQSLLDLHEAGGKRMRPYLFIAAYEALGGSDYKGVLPIGAALELLHTALLIHDDVIDRDYVRRGASNVAGTYQQRYAGLKASDVDKQHFSNSAAILAGDLMISEAYQLIFASHLPAVQKIKAAQLLGETTYVVAGGELLDTEAVLYPPDAANSLQIAELKTAFYSCVTPLVMGGVLAETDDATLALLKDVGTNFGIAFQLVDDIAGVFGNPKQTGKATVGDLREGKRTYLLQRTLQLASVAQKKQLKTIIGNPAADKTMMRQAREIMVACGAKAEVEKSIKQYVEQAAQAVNKLPISNESKNTLVTFIGQI